jgi:integrase
MARNLTNKAIAALKPRAKQYTHADPQLPGHYIRVSPSGNKSFVAVARDPCGKQIWKTIGNTTLLDVETAREKARAIMLAVKGGKSADGPETFQAVASEWLKRHVEAKGLRSDYDIRRFLKKHLMPAWGSREFESIRRSDITALLDQVEDESGARSADYVLSIFSGIANWHAARHDDYASPIIRGMRRHSTKDNARRRILTDEEIRTLWNDTNGNGYADMVKLLLLTGQRRDKVASMKWEDISDNGVWSVPNGKRQKGVGGDLPLPDLALEIIKSRPRFASNVYVFAGRGENHTTNFRHDRYLAKFPDMQPWVLHDLRRTARSLMSRAGVRPDVAERVLGHAIKGVEGTYDRHSYREEKAHALRALAGLIETIVNPPASNVVGLYK